MSSDFVGLSKNQTQTNERIKDLLIEFGSKQKDVQGQMVVIFPSGVPIANTWSGDINEILVGAISATVKLTFQHLCSNLKKGNMTRLFVNSEDGKIIIQNTGPKAILCTILWFDVDLYRIAFMTSDLAKKITHLIGQYK